MLICAGFSAQTDSSAQLPSDPAGEFGDPIAAKDTISPAPGRSEEISETRDLPPENPVENISYQLHLDKEWKSLATFCEKSISEGTDYFYLRLRAGIAFYELRMYRAAAGQFEKALQFNPADQLALEYLYYSYIFTNRIEHARKLSLLFDPATLIRTNTEKRSQLNFISSDNGIKAIAHPGYENALYFNLGISHTLQRRLSLFHGATYFSQNELRFKVAQSQYYLSASIPARKSLLFSAAVHLISSQQDIYDHVPATITGTIQSPPPAPGMPPPPTQTVLIRTTREITRPSQNMSTVINATLVKETKLTTISAGFTGAVLDTATQVQLNGGLCVYPFQHNRLSIGAKVYFHTENTQSSAVAFYPYIAAQPFKRLALNLGYFKNSGNNISEFDGYLVTNSIDYTRERLAATVSYGLNSSFWLFGTYAYETKQHLNQKFYYQYQVISLGFKVLAY